MEQIPYTSLSTICNSISEIFRGNKNLTNITTKCIVKKINKYPYSIYINVVDLRNSSIAIKATIEPKLYQTELKENDVIYIRGSVIYYKSISFKIYAYHIDTPQISNYDKIILQLKDKNIYDIEKKTIPQIIKNVAIISSTNASGLKDCLNVMKNLILDNIYIYPTTLQGVCMEKDVISCIEQCNKDKKKHKIDIILIIRGGGARTDLEWFDNFNIAKSVKQSKIPIICGIGHETDHGIMDVICDKSCTTPTQVAYYINEILEKYMNINSMINNIYRNKVNKLISISNKIDNYINQQQQIINRDIENTRLKINYSYENKFNKLLKYYNQINTKLNDEVIKYQKSIENINQINNMIDTKINNLRMTTSELINKYSVIKLHNKTTKKYISTKRSIINAFENDDEIYIKIKDGSFKIKFIMDD